MSITTGARFPIRLDPVPGESFDGWIDAYAQRLLMSGLEFGQALELPPRLLRLHGANVAKGDAGLDAERIAARACGADPAAVRWLWFGLARYDRLIAERVARGDARRRAVTWFGRVLRPMVPSRWCPTCLAQSGGRWLAAWRLPWYLACPTHHTMLATGCPACGGTQRYAGLRAAYVPELLTSCSRPTAGQAGRRDHRCRENLTTIATAAAPDGLVALQSEMIAILDPTISETEALALVDRLVDLLIIAIHAGLDLRAIDRGRRNLQNILSAPLGEAHRALSDPRGARMRAIANSDPARIPAALPQAFDGVSAALAAILINHRDHRLGPTERLRHRSMTASARRPEGIDPSKRLRSLPLALWPDWSVRLRPPTIPPYTFRVAAAAALCVPGTTRPIQSIYDHWPGPRNRARMITFGRLITADPHGTAILAALCAIAEILDRDGAPIDYERRRQLADETELLDSRAWKVMCRAGGTPAGSQPKLAHARVWLWETLTGGLPRQAPSQLSEGCPEFLSRHSRCTLDLPATTVRQLNEHARRLLDTHGCHHEPITWSPATNGIPVDRLPGPDPDALDPDRVHAAISAHPARQHAAAQLGITVEHLHYIARKHPSEIYDPAAATAPHRVRFAAVLGATQLRELIDQGHSLRHIEASTGINRRTLRDELIAHGIPIPPRNHASRHPATATATFGTVIWNLGASLENVFEQLEIEGGPMIWVQGRPAQGTRHEILYGELPNTGEPVVVKLERISGALENERRVLAAFGTQNPVAPRLLAAGAAVIRGQRVTCLVTERRPGSPPTTTDGWWRMGRALAGLSEMRLPSSNLTVLDPVTFAGRHAERLKDLGDRLLPLARSIPDWQQLASPKIPASTPLVITHGDPGPGNYLDNGNDGTLIDWEEAHIAPRGLDLARLVFIALLGAGPHGYLARDHQARADAAVDGYLSALRESWWPARDEARWWTAVAGIQFVHRRWQLGGRPAPWEDAAEILLSALTKDCVWPERTTPHRHPIRN